MANNKRNNITRRKGGSKKRSTSKSRSKSRGFFQSPSPESLKNRCPICLETIRSNHIKTKCGHNFHKKCLIEWCENQKKKTNIKCPMCREPIQETCDKIIPFDSTDIFKYTNIAGADKKRRSEYIAKVAEFVNNPEFDVNVVNPRNNISILEDLTIYANAFYSSIEKLLDNKDIKIDEHLIALIQSEYHHDDKIKNLFTKNRHGMNTRSKNKIKILKKLL
jgi:hypothetical protein